MTAEVNAEKKYVGQSIPRVEDQRLLTGRGEYSDDLNLAGQAYATFLRAEVAHGWLRRVDTAAAKAAPGVLAVLTGADYEADGIEPLRHRGNPPDVELKNRNGQPLFQTPVYPIVTGKIRRVGEAVAVVVAETPAQAKDAAELIEVKIEALDPVIAIEDAIAEGAPRLWDEVPGNIIVDAVKGDVAAVDAAFAAAAHVATLETFNNRVTGVPMEPRAAIGEYDAAADRYTLNAGGQGVNRFQTELSAAFGVEPGQVHVISRDVGGGYGTRNSTYAEFVLVLWAARRAGRPVKWTADRSECFLSDYSGRNLLTRAELALDADGRFLAMRTENLADLGSHAVTYVPLARGPSVASSVYDIPLVHLVSKGVLTNSAPTTAYRGAGRPEAIFVMERLIDRAAEAMGIDRVDLRRRNLIPAAAMPYANQTGMTYDSGEFERGMDMALARGDWAGFEARRAESRQRGLLRGIGLANYIETATGWPVERGEVEVIGKEGIIELVIGTQASGQGHETAYAQAVADMFGLPFDSIRLKTGDTDFVRMGAGSHSSRSMRLAGHLFGLSADQIIDKGKRIAAHVLETSTADIDYADGQFQVVGTDRGLGLFDAAAMKDLPEDLAGPLAGSAQVTELIPAFPNGTHVVEVEVDPDTGVVRIVRYTAVDDVGRVVNPMLVDGQTHGGIAQGVGQALMENGLYDFKSGQLIAGSFMDYAMPRADDMLPFDLEFNEVPAPSTKLGVKGGGEGGTTGAPAAVVSAIVDALREFGIKHIEMPATPERIWRAIRTAGVN
jgi:carbon-monoxide dehydrogenase large subunit